MNKIEQKKKIEQKQNKQSPEPARPGKQSFSRKVARVQRLDHFVAEEIPGLSRKKAKALVDQGLIRVNGQRMRYAAHELNIGDVVEIPASSIAARQVSRFSLQKCDILFNQNHLIAINKAPGLPSQAVKSTTMQHVVPLVQEYFSSKDQPRENLWLLHRLDKETSGVLLLADNKKTADFIFSAFKQRKIKKTYHALVNGIFEGEFVEECYLSAINEKTGLVTVVNSGGLPSLTAFKSLKIWHNHRVTLLECRPHTGRSHQIRVHLAKNHLPIIGDKVYGDGQQTNLSPAMDAIARQHHFLHAKSLEFNLPDSADKSIPLHIEAPYPQTWIDMMDLLTRANL